MGNIFKGHEVAALGIAIENNGRDFYKACAERSKNPEIRKSFIYLAGEEEKHISVFEKILNSVHPYTPPAAFSEEYFAYLNALARDYVFTRANTGKDAAKTLSTDKEAIAFAIGVEKDSILFYEGMKKFIPQGDIPLLNELIAQEQQHLINLLGLSEEQS